MFFLEADRLALGMNRIKPRLFIDAIWRFQRLLRKVEYYTNCKKKLLYQPIRLLYKYLLYRRRLLLGFTIPINVFDSGLSIAHIGTIVVNGNARTGKNCRIHICTNIGNGASTSDTPILGDNIYIGPGAKIFGNIEIADNIAIGANAVVNKSFLTPGVTIGGIPARVISQKGSYGLLRKNGYKNES